MSQTSCQRCGLLVPMRWLHAGGELFRPNHIHQCAVRPAMRSERLFKCPGHSPHSRASRYAAGVVLPSRPQSTSALTSNPHSARC